MTKTELYRRVSQTTGIRPERLTPLLDTTFETISKALIEGHDVKIKGFGTFHIHRRAARKWKSIKTGETNCAPPRASARFRPGRRLSDEIRRAG